MLRVRPDSLLGRLARGNRPKPWLRITVSPRWARLLVAAGAQPASTDTMTVTFTGQTDVAVGVGITRVIRVHVADDAAAITPRAESERVVMLLEARRDARHLAAVLAQVGAQMERFGREADFSRDATIVRHVFARYTGDLQGALEIGDRLYRMLRRLAVSADEAASVNKMLGTLLRKNLERPLRVTSRSAATWSLSIDVVLSMVDVVKGRLGGISIDASGLDLSKHIEAHHLKDMQGVVWTSETRWPADLADNVRAQSREIRPGVFEFAGDLGDRVPEGV
ncbi:hypothetical protein [Planotetraspora mira]|uniref:Uncharacterized protein n=1 Tax=Planotetraspora mira TaxID=58121 RepID=A0A8J3TY97_9ACTN|nr:hypothetical protein [Planotetraspora mira]GII34156.1 hypothetical protein Pmi06nite_75980 [Planotetraspora mira]